MEVKPEPKSEAVTTESREREARPADVVMQETPAPRSSNAVEAAPLVEGRWRVIEVKNRVDSFNQSFLIQELRDARDSGVQRIALDLSSNRFLSLPALKVCVEVAAALAERGGAFALVGCQQKTKRHFEIYGTLEHIKIARLTSELK